MRNLLLPAILIVIVASCKPKGGPEVQKANAPAPEPASASDPQPLLPGSDAPAPRPVPERQVDSKLPQIALSVNGQRFPQVARGWPLFVEVRLEAGVAPFTIGGEEGSWTTRLALEVTGAKGESMAWPFRPALSPAGSLRLDDTHAGRMIWTLAPEESAKMAPGEYQLKARLGLGPGGPGIPDPAVSPSASAIILVVEEPAKLSQDIEEEKMTLRIRWLLLSGDRAGALEAAEDYLKGNPKSPLAFTLSGDALEGNGRFREAAARYDLAIEEVLRQKPDARTPPRALLERREAILRKARR